jgi:hypothetical protein
MIKTIHVLAKHITVGKVRDFRCCPVALALQEAGYRDAIVTVSRRNPDQVQFYGVVPGQILDVEDTDLYEKIDAYDCGGLMKPFSFTLELP